MSAKVILFFAVAVCGYVSANPNLFLAGNYNLADNSTGVVASAPKDGSNALMLMTPGSNGQFVIGAFGDGGIPQSPGNSGTYLKNPDGTQTIQLPLDFNVSLQSSGCSMYYEKAGLTSGTLPSGLSLTDGGEYMVACSGVIQDERLYQANVSPKNPCIYNPPTYSGTLPGGCSIYNSAKVWLVLDGSNNIVTAQTAW